MQVGVVGRIQTRTWDDDQGVKHYVTEVVAEEAYFADSKKDSYDTGDTFANNFGNTMPGANNANSDFRFVSSSLPPIFLILSYYIIEIFILQSKKRGFFI